MRNGRRKFISDPEATLTQPFEEADLLNVWSEYSDKEIEKYIAEAEIALNARKRVLQLRRQQRVTA